MTATTIHLGYEVGSGDPVAIPLNHMIVTGQTQRSGKTTAMEALISRSGCRAVAFVTKRFERSFHDARRIPPYFRQRADWQFVAAILEATMRERYRYERPWIVRVSKGAKTLEEVHGNIQKAMKKAREGGRSHDVYLMLNEYLNIVVPALSRVRWAAGLELQPGLNVMDLSAMPPELHGLVISSVIEWIYARERDTVVVIPEAWEFLPQGRQSPVKLACEHLIRKGAGGANFVWLDSQDIAAIDVGIRKSAILWLLGVQREANEVRRVLEHVPVKKPKADAIMTLRLGEFFTSWEDQLTRVFAQPAWMAAEEAIAIARGQMSVGQVMRPAATTIEEEPVSKALEEKMDRLADGLSEVIAAMARNNAPPAAPQNNVPANRPAAVQTAPPAPVMAPDEEALYERFKARLLAEAPQDLRVILTRPELQVAIKREAVTVDEHSGLGRIAKLIKEGFFNSPVSFKDVWVEMKRRGWLNRKANTVTAQDLCAKMDKKGFLTRDGDMYQAVPGMKVNLIES